MNDRTATQTYAVCLRDVVEADEYWKSTSAEIIWEKRVPTNSLLERLVFELKYFSETNAHLDRKNITLCPASRCSDGDVVGVDWFDGRLYVYWCGPRRAYPFLRAREVAVS